LYPLNSVVCYCYLVIFCWSLSVRCTLLFCAFCGLQWKTRKYHYVCYSSHFLISALWFFSILIVHNNELRQRLFPRSVELLVRSLLRLFMDYTSV
jgi:hypothetical protein